jgi:hypothetical protein
VSRWLPHFKERKRNIMNESTITAPEATEVSYTPEELRAESTRIVTLTAKKHGLTPEDLSPELLQASVDLARRNLQTSNGSPYQTMYKTVQAENAALRAQLEEVKSQGVARATQSDRDTKVPTLDGLRAKIGDTQLHLLTADGKVRALGIDPASVNHELAQDIFGADPNTQVASDLMKSNPRLYRQLREISLIYGYPGKKKGK